MGLDDVVGSFGGQDFNGSGFTGSRFGAIFRAGELGKVLQADLPEIADDFRRGMNARQIVSERGIEETYEVNWKVAVAAVYNSLRGFDFKEISYSGLMDREEYNTVVLSHKRQSARRAMLAKGYVPWASVEEVIEMVGKNHPYSGKSERQAAFMLSEQDEFRRGPYADCELIAGHLNDELYGGELLRNASTVSDALSYERRRRGERVRGRWASVEEVIEMVGKNHPYSGKSEKQAAFMLSEQDEFRRGSYANSKLIAGHLNDELYGGELVRNATTVSRALSDERKRRGEMARVP